MYYALMVVVAAGVAFVVTFESYAFANHKYTVIYPEHLAEKKTRSKTNKAQAA